MKMTIEVDADRLERLMKAADLATKRDAIDFALSVTERDANKRRLLGSSISRADLEGAVSATYDVIALRKLDTPGEGA